MATTANSDLQGDQTTANAVREALARRRMSRQRLADEARISLSTLEKALAGRRPFTLATLIRLEQALGTPLRASSAAPSPTLAGPGQAPDALGAYSRAAVAWLEGDYLTFRPSFEAADAVYAYRTQIGWDDSLPGLRFHEAGRLDAAFAQSGSVSLPNQSGHIYLVTNDHGQFRVVTLSRPTITGELYGLLSTLHAGPGAQLTPAAAPIALVPLSRAPDAAFGRIAANHSSYAAYRAILDDITGRGFAHFFLR